MKYLIFLSAFLFFLSIAKAENKQEIMNLLAQKVRLEDPDTIVYSKEAKNELDDFMRKHRSLFNSLGKDEIFYHLELAFDLYNENRPGPQPHAVYSAYLYTKFYANYTEEENELISKRFNDFFEKGWIRPQDREAYQAARLEKDSTRPTSSTGSSKGFGEKILTTPTQSNSDDKLQETTTSKTSVEQNSKSTETKSLFYSVQWVIVAGVIVVGFVLMWILLKRRK